MVERFHHQLKAAIHAVPGLHRWGEFRSIILLGCCSVVKEDLDYSYGTTLAFLGQILAPIDLPITDTAS